MEETHNYWSDLYKKYYRVPKHKETEEKKSVGMPYKEIRQLFYKRNEVIADEPVIPDEEYQKELEMVKAYEAENAKLEETSNELTLEEIEEFKKLNGIKDEQEQPTETKVKSVKVSKPKEKKVVEKEKPVKDVKQKEAKPKAPRKPKK